MTGIFLTVLANIIFNELGFPIVYGREELLRVPKWSDSSCKTVVFPPYRFYPEKQVHVQITLNHMNLNDSETVHHAITSWTENVNIYNFTVCAMQSGRNGNNFNPFAALDWVAYQGAPPEGLTGMVQIQKWWSGTKCADVNFPKVGMHSSNGGDSCYVHAGWSAVSPSSVLIFFTDR